jgi:hypothetical protein
MTQPSRLRRLASSNLRLASIDSAVLELSMSRLSKESKDSQILPSKEVKDKRYDHTDKNAGGQWEIESKASQLNGDVAR